MTNLPTLKEAAEGATPRTDAKVFSIARGNGFASVVFQDFARCLERELSEAELRADDANLSCVAAEEDRELLRKRLTACQAELERAREDAGRLDWLELRIVKVSERLRYGSRPVFISSPEEIEGERDDPSDLRSKVDAAIAAQKGG